MSETALIELIQTRLGEELTAEQVSEIGAKLADRPWLAKALLKELSLDQGPPTEYAPGVTSFDDVIARIEILAVARRRERRMALAVLGTLVIVLLVAWTPALVSWLGRDDDGDAPPVVVAATRPATAAARSRPAAETQVATAPKVRSDDGKIAARKEPDTKAVAAPRTRPAGLDAAAPMTWREYLLPDTTEGSQWRKHVGKLFQRRQGKDGDWSSNNKYYQLDGTYGLSSLPAPGKMLRLGVFQSKKCDLEFWDRNDGVRILIEPQTKRIQVHSLTRQAAGAKPTVTGSFDDMGAWQWYRLGAVDLRYQDGQILICRGEIPLLRAAMAGPPTEGSVTASGVHLTQAEARTCRPLVIPAAEKIDKTLITETSAGKLTWKKKPEDKTVLSTDPGGVVSLSSEKDKDNDTGRAWFELGVPHITAMEVTMHVRQCTPLAGIFVQVKNVQDQIRMVLHKDKRVVGSGTPQEINKDILMGRVVDKEFWIRIRCGLDFLMVWVSPDGKRWWRRKYQPLSGSPDQLQIGIEIHPGKGPRGIAVDNVRIRRFEAVRRMAAPDAGLLAKATEALTEAARSAPSRAQALAIMDKARPKDADPAKWQKACDVHLLAGSPHAPVRLGAARELFLPAACRGADTDVQGILAVARELMEIAQLERTELPQLLSDVLEALGRSCLEAGKPPMLKAVVDAGYLRPGSMGLPRAPSLLAVPPGLLRMYLLDLIARGEWEAAWLEVMRSMFLTQGSTKQSLFPLARWAGARARARLGGKVGIGESDMDVASIHPLVVYGEREILNVMAEFIFMVRAKHYASACTVITGQTLPDALVFLSGEEDVLRTSHFRVREIIRTTPQLRQVLKERFSEIGMIRLERARKHNDLEALRSLAVQFYGTKPGFAAMHVLADRELSNGNFYRAAARYQVLQTEQDHQRREDAAAKFRLASAMLGQTVGKPTTQPVVLPGKTFSPQEFEGMVQRLVAAHKAASQTSKAAVDALGPGPRGTGAKLTRLADMPGPRVSLSGLRGKPTAFAVDGNCLVVDHFGKRFAIDWPSKRLLWALPTVAVHRAGSGRWRGSTSGAVKPLRIGNKMYVRSVQRGGPLVCVETKTGKVLWSRSYDNRVLSDPVLIDSWLYIVTASSDMFDALYLHRVSPETGESSLRSELVQVRDGLPAIGRPAVVGDGILFRASGSLIKCNHRGAVQWARRLLFVPPDALSGVHGGMGLEDILIWQDKQVIFTAPGCPYVMCVAADSGKLSWSYMIHSSARLVGLVAGSAIVVESDRICALDPATGKILWQRRCSTEDMGILPAEKDTVVLVRLKNPTVKPESTPHRGRYIRWISAKDGRVARELPVDGDAAIYDVWKLFSDGKRLFGVSNFKAGQPASKVFQIDIAG